MIPLYGRLVGRFTLHQIREDWEQWSVGMIMIADTCDLILAEMHPAQWLAQQPRLVLMNCMTFSNNVV